MVCRHGGGPEEEEHSPSCTNCMSKMSFSTGKKSCWYPLLDVLLHIVAGNKIW